MHIHNIKNLITTSIIIIIELIVVVKESTHYLVVTVTNHVLSVYSQSLPSISMI